jgi:heme/copper-type cytochrome/quinol oxidase subunit 2
MTEFNTIQEIWNSQSDTKPKQNASDLIAKAEEQTKTLKHNHYWTIGIISVTVFILLFYFFWTNSHQFNSLTIGLSIMIVMLIVRIILEINSTAKLKSIKPDLSLTDYSQKVKTFYEGRKKIHLILTPIIYISYFLGFTMLLPTFKVNFSNGFYLYCLVSGYGFFFVFGYFLIRQIRKELKLIEFLKGIK